MSLVVKIKLRSFWNTAVWTRQQSIPNQLDRSWEMQWRGCMKSGYFRKNRRVNLEKKEFAFWISCSTGNISAGSGKGKSSVISGRFTGIWSKSRITSRHNCAMGIDERDWKSNCRTPWNSFNTDGWILYAFPLRSWDDSRASSSCPSIPSSSPCNSINCSPRFAACAPRLPSPYPSVFYKLKSAQFIIEKVPTLKKPTLKLLSKRGPLYYWKGAHFCPAQTAGDKISIA